MLGDDRLADQRFAGSVLVLGTHPELVLLPFLQVAYLEVGGHAEAADLGPGARVTVLLLHYIVLHILGPLEWGLPGQAGRLGGDVGHLERALRGGWSIWTR